MDAGNVSDIGSITTSVSLGMGCRALSIAKAIYQLTSNFTDDFPLEVEILPAIRASPWKPFRNYFHIPNRVNIMMINSL